MHFHLELNLPPAADVTDRAKVEQLVSTYLEPPRERWDEATQPNRGWWDWWQIGGRYTGAHDEYEPAKDERNLERCWRCRGEHSESCCSCDGTGQVAKCPTGWAAYDGDVAYLRTLYAKKPGLKAYMLLVPSRKPYIIDQWSDAAADAETVAFDGKVFPKLEELGIKDGYLVTVDYHC